MAASAMNRTVPRVTVVEVAVVFVAVAIGASLAVPHFGSGGRDDDQRIVAKALALNIQHNAAVVHAIYREQPHPITSIELPGIPDAVRLVHGFPGTNEIRKLLDDEEGVSEVDGVFSINAAADPGRCGVRYVESAADDAMPTIELLLTGCG